jgi:hypothetical protein
LYKEEDFVLLARPEDACDQSWEVAHEDGFVSSFESRFFEGLIIERVIIISEFAGENSFNRTKPCLARRVDESEDSGQLRESV